jgi:hypothetical protein
LSPLTVQETARLVHGLLERAVLPADVQAALLDRAGGNPLYAEEFARIALERGALDEGAGALPLPASVQSLIAARLDALSGEEKALVKDASVVGKVFWLGAVEQLSGIERDQAVALLHGLERKQFVQRERRSSIDGDTQYVFAHTLMRDVAYGQIPRADRTEKHRRAAAWVESLGRREDYAEQRAHHYSSALEALPPGVDGTDLITSARLALRDAGDRAVALNAFGAAARDYDRALELWPPDDLQRPRLLLAAAFARREVEDGDEAEVAAARDALLVAGDREGAAEAEVARAEVYWSLGRGADVQPSLAQATELAEQLPISAAKARVYTALFRLHWLANREDLAGRFRDEAMRMADELGLQAVRARILSISGAWRVMKGDPEGFDDLEESIAISERLNSATVQSPYNNLADGYYNVGDLTKATETTDRMRTAWKRFANVDWLRWTDSQQIRLDYLAGRWDDVLELADRWIAEAQAGPGHYLEPAWRWYRGRLLLARDDASAAVEESALGLERARVAADPQMLIPALGFHTRVRWALGDAEAEERAAELADVCRRSPLGIAHDWFPEVAIALAGLGRTSELEVVAASVPTPTPWRDAAVALGRGDPLTAVEIFQAMRAGPFEAEARVLAAGEGLESDLPRAIRFFRQVGASTSLLEAERLLATTRSA